MINTAYAAVTFLAVTFAGQSMAKPVELDTPDVHVVVVRPLDNWDQNNSVIGSQYKANIAKHFYSFKLLNPDEAANKEIYDGVQAQVESLGFSVPTEKPYSKAIYFVNPTVNMSGEDANKYTVNQNKLWKYKTIALWERNAAIAASSTRSEGSIWSAIGEGLVGGIGGSLIGNAVGKAMGGMVGAVMANGGGAAPGAEIGVNMGSQTSQSSSAPEKSMSDEDLKSLLGNPVYGFNQVPNVNYSKYQSVDVVNVGIANGNTGTIIVAYKKPKTPQLAQAILIKALPSVMSLDETSTERYSSAEKNRKERTILSEQYDALMKRQQ